ncbi:MAG: hypothetical protein J6W29_00175 [Neisseriaceae bacterium]|nr:hypothetical protein [Neisseriaceae bacterium]
MFLDNASIVLFRLAELIFAMPFSIARRLRTPLLTQRLAMTVSFFRQPENQNRSVI